MNHIQGVLVGRSQQTDRMETTSNEGVVQFDTIRVGHLTQFTTLQHRQQTRPIARTTIQNVAPACAHLRQNATLIGRKVQEEFTEESLVLEQLTDVEDRRKHGGRRGRLLLWQLDFPYRLRCALLAAVTSGTNASATALLGGIDAGRFLWDATDWLVVAVAAAAAQCISDALHYAGLAVAVMTMLGAQAESVDALRKLG